MEARKKIGIGILLMVLGINTSAQRIWEERKGCFRGQGNLAAGYLFQQRQVGAYITGDMDLFFDNKVSMAGSAWYSFAVTNKDQPGLRANHAIFGGLNYHFTKKGRFDPYIGLTPGVSLVSVAYREGETMRTSSICPVPVISAAVGMNYYIGSIFHFFAKVQGVSGQTLGNIPVHTRLEEIKITAGLGWNIRIWKPKHRGDSLPVLFRGKNG